MSQKTLKINIFHANLHFSVCFSDSAYETFYSQGFILIHDGISSYNNYVHIPTSKREGGKKKKKTEDGFNSLLIHFNSFKGNKCFISQCPVPTFKAIPIQKLDLQM